MKEIITCGRALCGQAFCGEVISLDESMYENFSNKPILTHSNGPNSSIINLKSGMLKLETNDVSFGNGPMAISFSHVYNSKMESDLIYLTNDKGIARTYMGDGFKLNLQQYLFPVVSGEKIYDSDIIRFHYIDGSGTRHNIAQNGDVLYDTSGLGLILNSSQNGFAYYGAEDATYKLEDRQGNMLFFDGQGRIVATRSVFCSANTFAYEGLSTKLLSVTTSSVMRAENNDTELSSRTARLVYNSNNLLEEIEYDETYENGLRTSNKNPRMKFQYQGRKLISISKIKDNDARIITKFVYPDANTFEVCSLGDQILRFESLDGKVHKIIEKARDDNGGFHFRRSDTLDYFSIWQTKVTNDKGICIAYNMDGNGELYSTVEEKGDYSYAIAPQPDGYGDELYLTELSNSINWKGFIRANTIESGVISNVPNTYFNQTQVVKINGGGDDTERFISSNIIKANEMNKDPNGVFKQSFTLSCWVKTSLNIEKNANQRIHLEVEYDDGESPEFVLFEEYVDTKLNDWQLVCVPITIEKRKVKNAKVRVFNNNTTEDLYLADIRMVQGGMPEHIVHLLKSVTVGGITLPVKSSHALTKIKSLELNKTGDSTQKISLDDNMAFTACDVEQTLRNIKLAYSDGKTTYNISLNNGKRIISNVKEIFINNSLGLWKTSIIDGFSINQYSGLKDSVRTMTTTVYETNKSITTITASKLNSSGSYDAKDSEITETSFEGLPTRHKDGYGVETNYTYDAFGNLTRMSMKGADGKICYQDYKYQANGEHFVDSWDSRNSGNAAKETSKAVSSTFLNPSGLIGSVTQPKETDLNRNRITTFKYDSLQERLVFVSALNGLKENQNEITYNDKGEIQSLKHNGTSFGFEYDHFGRIKNHKASGVTILDKEYTYNLSTKQDKERTIYANGNYQNDYTDRYGFHSQRDDVVVEIKPNDPPGFYPVSHCAKMTYEDKREQLSSAAQIRNITDGFDNSETIFSYNNNDKMQGYHIDWAKSDKYPDLVQFEIAEETPNESEDGLDQAWKQSIIIKDGGKKRGIFNNTAWTDGEKVLKARLIKTASTFVQTCACNSYEKEYIATTKYEYDSLGRPATLDRSINSTKVKSEISYLSSDVGDGTTDFISRQRIFVNNSSSPTHTFDYTYHPDGRIASVSKKTSIYGTKMQYFTYDKLGRLYKNFSYDGSTDFTEFLYDEGGNVISKLVGNNLHLFSYENSWKDQLSEMYTGGEHKYFTYDKCGNPVRYKTVSTTAENNMLWTRGRLLSSYNNADYTYNKDGILSCRNDGDRKVRYIRDGTKLVAEYRKTGKEVQYIHYIYDAAGLVGIAVDNGCDSLAHYAVVTDTFGTVHELRDEKNNVAASFTYDSWGACTASGNAASLCRFRWKGYYQDETSKFYYINGNWYDPETGRFINSGTVAQLFEGAGVINGLNLYAFNLNDQTNAAGSAENIESAYDLTPQLTERYSKPKKRWKIFMTILLAVIAIAGVALAVFTGGASLAASGASFLGIAGIVLTSVGGLITVLNAVASVQEAFSENGYNFMRDGLCGGNAKLHKALAITGAVMMVAGGIMSSINMSNASKAAMANKQLKGTNCFVAGTLVLTETGHKKIEDIDAGEKVWAHDEETGESDWKEVVRLFRNESYFKTTLSIDCEDKPIECTPEHPFYILNTTTDRDIVRFEGKDETEGLGRWVAAKDLKIGDKCLLSDNKTAIITSVKTEKLDEPFKTYNFEVADFHTYYVGEQGILVHNSCETPINELNHTNGKNLSNKEFGNLKADIKANGIQDSVKYTEINGSKYIVDGNHRVAAARQLGMKTVPTQNVSLPYGQFTTAGDVLSEHTNYLLWRQFGGKW